MKLYTRFSVPPGFPPEVPQTIPKWICSKYNLFVLTLRHPKNLLRSLLSFCIHSPPMAMMEIVLDPLRQAIFQFFKNLISQIK